MFLTIEDSKTRFIWLRSRLFAIRCGGQCIKPLVNACADVVLSLVVTCLHKRGVSRRVLMSFAARRGEERRGGDGNGVTRRDAHRSRRFLFLDLGFIVTHPIVHRSRAWSIEKRWLLPRTFAAPILSHPSNCYAARKFSDGELKSRPCEFIIRLRAISSKYVDHSSYNYIIDKL